MVTEQVTAGRDWEALRNDIKTIGREAAARKHGYLSAESATASLRNHDIRVQAGGKQGMRTPTASIRKITDAENPVIPEFIEQQLLSVEMLPIESLIVDRKFQREEDTQRQRKMAAEWEWLACGNICVNLRTDENGNNVYSVIDGQQRLGAIRLQGYKEAPCRVYVELNEQQEAMLFELLNKSKKPGYNDLFKSRLSRGEPVAKAINMAVEQVNYHLDPERKHSSASHKDSHFYIGTMKELENIYQQGGVLAIMDTLKLVKEIFAPEYLGQQAMIISGTAEFIRNYPEFIRSDLINKMKKKGQLKLIQTAFQWAAVHGGKAQSSKTFCEAMVVTYNEGKQTANRLHSKNV